MIPFAVSSLRLRIGMIVLQGETEFGYAQLFLFEFELGVSILFINRWFALSFCFASVGLGFNYFLMTKLLEISD